jgi:YVTN family beta-propeller protein
MFVDIRGYTDFTSTHGADEASLLVARFTQAASESISANAGQVRGTWGDEVFAVFGSARDAVRSAVSMQDRFVAATVASGAVPLLVGVGLDVGEAVDAGEATSGSAVNVAARLCSRAGPGQVLATSELVHLAGAIPGVVYEEHGQARLKGVPGRTRLVQLRSTTQDKGQQAAFRAVVHNLPSRRRRRQRRRAVVAWIAAAAVLVGSGTWWLTRGSGQPPVVAANTVGVIDTGSGQLLGTVPVGQSPAGVAADGGQVWVANTGEGTVSRIDQQTDAVTQTVHVGSGPVALAALGQDVWVVNGLSGTVSQVSTQTDQVVDTIPVGNEPSAIAAGFGRLWVTDQGDGQVTAIDPTGVRPAQTIDVGDSPDGIAAGDGAVWVSNRADDRVSKIDPVTMTVGSPIPVGAGPSAIVAAASGVWVVNGLDLTVSRIDPRTGFATTARVGDTPTAIAVDAGSVWVADAGGGTVDRIDPGSGQVTRSIFVGGSPRGLALVGSSLWVTARGFASTAHRGGTLTIANDASYDSIDPAVTSGGDEGWMYLIYDGLVAFNRAPGAARYELVPDLALTLPTPTDTGLTYTFTLRPGIRYSNGTPLKASDLRRGIERGFSQDAVGNGSLLYFSGLLGADACVRHPGPCDLSRGIEVNDSAGTVTFLLTAADPDFLDKLALHSAYPAPPGAPNGDVGTDPLPGTGPYKISQYVPDPDGGPALLSLVRNTQFHQWSSAAQPAGYPDAIRWEPEVSWAATLDAVEHGRADVASPPTAVQDQLARDYPGQWHTQQSLKSSFIVLNTRIPPFNSLAARQAVEYAFDSGRVTIGRDLPLPDPLLTACRMVPQGFPGSSAGCPYPYDQAKVTALAAHSARYSQPVNLYFFGNPLWMTQGEDTKRILNQLGNTAVNIIYKGPAPPYLAGKPMNVFGVSYYPDFPAASQFYDPIFSCSAFLLVNNFNWGGYCNRTIDDMAIQAQLSQVSNPGTAARLWKQVFAMLDLDAVVIPTIYNTAATLVSARVGNYQSDPLYNGPDLDQLWVNAVGTPSPAATHASTANSCPSSDATCIGPLAAGEYTTVTFQPQLTYRVPAGWANFQDLPGNFLLVPPGGNKAGVDAGTSDAVGVFTSIAIANGCGDGEAPGVGRSVPDIAGWMVRQPGLVTTRPRSASIGGLSGVVLDVKMANGWTKTCPWSNGNPVVPLIVGYGPSGFNHSIGPGYAMRLYLLHNGSNTLAIEVDDATGGQHLNDYSAVINDLKFGQ